MKHSMPNWKLLKKVRKMKKNEEMSIPFGDDEVDIICIGKEQYLMFTSDSFYEINYDELLQKYR